MAFPLAKVAGLLIKTLAKPVSKEIKHQFVKQPFTRRSLITIGQSSHAIVTRMTVWSSGFKVRSVPKIEDELALSQGAEFLGESFLFAVSGGIMVYEYTRSSAKEKEREAARLQVIRDDASRLQKKLVSLDKRLVALEEYAKMNRSSILGIQIGASQNFEPGELVPITDEECEEEGDGNAILLKEKRKQDKPDLQTVQTSTNETERTWRWW